jgi:uncharacterized iron-regulated membrane protein
MHGSGLHDSSGGELEAQSADRLSSAGAEPTRQPSRVRRLAMRPRRALVLVHRWLALVLVAWVIVVGATGAWLVGHHAIESWFDGDRYRATPGDVGPQAATDAALEAFPEGATSYGLTLPRNGRGVYHVYGEVPPPEGAAETEEPGYLTAYVDPGSGIVNSVRDEEAGASWWLYRGHMYLWQDHGVAGVFDPETGWCRRDSGGAEPGGVRGVVCDVMPDGMDIVGYMAIAFVVVLLTGFYLWYWPGVRRWATAFVIRRRRGPFAFNLSIHKVVGFVVWVPLLVVTFTGAAFAFPNMNKWFDNATPAQRDFDLWVPGDDVVSGDADGREPIGLDRASEILAERYPDRAINYLAPPYDETGHYTAWVTRGLDPWTREGGAGNTYVALDQYTGETLYDGTPEEGNVFDQAWDDWSFPLHTGDFGGSVSRVLWTLVGLSPLVLAVTGVVMYVIRLQKRRRRARRHDHRVAIGWASAREAEPAAVGG